MILPLHAHSLKDLFSNEFVCNQHLVTKFFSEENMQCSGAELHHVTEKEDFGINHKFIRYWNYYDSSKGKWEVLAKDQGKVGYKLYNTDQEQNYSVSIEYPTMHLLSYSLGNHSESKSCDTLSSYVYIVLNANEVRQSDEENNDSSNYFHIIKLPKKEIIMNPNKVYAFSSELKNANHTFCRKGVVTDLQGGLEYEIFNGKFINFKLTKNRVINKEASAQNTLLGDSSTIDININVTVDESYFPGYISILVLFFAICFIIMIQWNLLNYSFFPGKLSLIV
ncbi:unnamed protein product [Moneuplotes crassus]|uniref:Uncharacterized protein n=1 Tax=Euplotes crassus TaxID=5936 RepID=A0AAD1U4J0_EUPCR|nr:unnamed protein product [Moneuplotes crassus]